MTRQHHDFGTTTRPDSRQIQRNIRIDQQEFLRRQVAKLTVPAECRPAARAEAPTDRR
ncbi:hypothetical protein FIU94_10500 [Sulfitobacter sp. THAF37]|uniref:hypothetical protein n=1 Tax=Sulfitobacter sp. THAF37 TaxID=2587855 RepID=UPI0012A79A90|nr:hypothetical protein [Sulfitobacter sp. THAF37]QFT59255.1 hypothetical protein FIU94_10500 [Sulfitobacter sp. THAF37]